jgi:hypothetical protein
MIRSVRCSSGMLVRCRRTRFPGNIASLTSASPLDAVKELWGGNLPEFSDGWASTNPDRR